MVQSSNEIDTSATKSSLKCPSENWIWLFKDDA